MPAEFNKANLMGHLTRDPEYMTMSDDSLLCKFAIASNYEWNDKKTGRPKKEVCFMEIVVYGHQAQYCKSIELAKGKQILVEGRIKQETWDDPKTQQKRHKHVIIANKIVSLFKIESI